MLQARSIIALVPAAVALLAFATTVQAQDVRVYGARDRVDPSDVAQILDRRSAPPPLQGKTRSLRLLDDTAAVQAQGGVQTTAYEPAPAGARADALSLPVQFRFDSAEILPEARAQLDAIAQGIRLLPADQHVVIEGHTDAVGSEAYNEALSLRRAHSVRRYLVNAHGIDARRLRASGLGELSPLPGTQPDEPANRRVQFRGE